MSTTKTAKTITDYSTGIDGLRNGTAHYIPCDITDIPVGVRFDVPPRNQGQIVEVAYGTKGSSPATAGDAWKRETDRSCVDSVRYYRLVRS